MRCTWCVWRWCCGRELKLISHRIITIWIQYGLIVILIICILNSFGWFGGWSLFRLHFTSTQHTSRRHISNNMRGTKFSPLTSPCEWITDEIHKIYLYLTLVGVEVYYKYLITCIKAFSLRTVPACQTASLLPSPTWSPASDIYDPPIGSLRLA